MERQIYQAIADNLEDVVKKYDIIDVSRTVRLSSFQDVNTKIDLNNLPPNINRFNVDVDEVRIAKVIIWDNLSSRSVKAINNLIQETVKRVTQDFKVVEESTEHHIWRNILFGNLNPYQEFATKEKYNIRGYKSYGLFVFRTRPPLNLTDKVIKHIQFVMERYIGDDARIHIYQTGKGECALVVELASGKNVDITKLSERVRQASKSIIDDIVKNEDFKKSQICIVGSDKEYFIEDLSQIFMALRNFAKLFLRSSPRSRLVYYERNPLYMLIQHMDMPSARKYVQTVFKEGYDEVTKQTIQAYINQCFNVSQAADSLGVHRHTLEYRLNNYFTSAANSRARFQEALEYYLAFLMMDVFDIDLSSNIMNGNAA